MATRLTEQNGRDVRKALNIRIRPETRQLLDRGAEVTGKNLTDFVLDAARQAAQNALLDRAVIQLDREAYSGFVALLDAPPQPNARLRKSLHTPAPWE